MPGVEVTKFMERIHFVGKLASALSPDKKADLGQNLTVLVPNSVPVAVAYEIVLQSYLFFGYAQAIESAKTFSETMLKKQILIPHSVDENAAGNAWRKRGEALCRKIYAPNFERLVANMAAVSPELSDWMIDEGYGKVLSRPGPTELEREVASVVFLAISGHPVQLYSHIRGAKNLGASEVLMVSISEHSDLSESQQKLVLSTIEKVYGS